MVMRSDEIRTELAARLGSAKAIGDRVWQWLADEGHLGRVESGERDLAWLVERVVNFHDAAGSAFRVLQPKPQLVPKTNPQADQISARSMLLAREAGQLPEVQAFRRDVLNGRMLKPEEVETWVKTASKTDEAADRPGGYVTVPQPKGAQVSFRDKHLALEPDTLAGSPVVRLSSEFLAYGVPESAWIRRTVARYGGILDRLRHLAESLERRYDWPEALGTLFVLTDMVPLVSRVRQTVHGGSGRITFNIDVATVTPRQLAQFYGRTLARLRKGRRIRALTTKHLRLAVFAVERSEKSWGRRFTEWNKEFPKWRYTAESNFRRDALQAERRLVEPAFSLSDTFDYATDRPAPRLSPGELEQAHAEDSAGSRPSSPSTKPKRRRAKK